MALVDAIKNGTEECGWPAAAEAVQDAMREARRTIKQARHAAEDALNTTTHQVRRYPLQAVGAALAFGLFAGMLFGFGAGRFIRTPTQ